MIESYTSFDIGNMNCVPVIASFTSDGHIKPLYVRLNGVSYKIEKSWIKSSLISYTTYICQVSSGDTLIPLTLTYHPREGVWSVLA